MWRCGEGKLLKFRVKDWANGIRIEVTWKWTNKVVLTTTDFGFSRTTKILRSLKRTDWSGDVANANQYLTRRKFNVIGAFRCRRAHDSLFTLRLTSPEVQVHFIPETCFKKTQKHLRSELAELLRSLLPRVQSFHEFVLCKGQQLACFVMHLHKSKSWLTFKAVHRLQY